MEYIDLESLSEKLDKDYKGVLALLQCPMCHSGALMVYIFSVDEDVGVIEDGLIVCKSCYRFYPIKSQCIVMLPDQVRLENPGIQKSHLEFLKKYQEKLPYELLKKLRPYTLSEQ